MKLENLRKDMYIKTIDYLQDQTPVMKNFLNNSFAGSGKSFLTCKALADSDSFFIYLVNEHNIGAEQMEHNKVLFDLMQIKSRNKLCKHEQYKMLASKGVSIKHFCKDCGYMGVCEYYQRMNEIWKEPQSWIGVHHHLGGLVNLYVEEKHVDAVVIDEYFLQGIWTNFKVYYKLLIDTINLVSGMPDSNEKIFVIDVLREFVITFKQHKLNTDFIHERIYKYFRLYGTPLDLKLFYYDYERRLAELYFQSNRIFNNIVTLLCKTLFELYKQQKPAKDPDYLNYMNNVMRYVKGEKFQYIDIGYYDLDALNLNCKIIILDATTPAEFYENIFNREIVTLKNKIVVNSKIYQLSSAKYCMRTLDDEKNNAFTRLKNIVKLISEKHNQEMLVVSRMKYEKNLEILNPDLISTGHYPLFGSNDFKHINIVVLFGTPEPKRDVLERKAHLLNIGYDLLYYLEREAFMLQAIHRIRCNIKDEPTYIYVLSKVDLNLQNSIKLSIGKLEKLLQNQPLGYVTQENEERIKNDVCNYLDISDLPLSELTGLVTGNSVIVSDIIKLMEKKGEIETYKLESTGRGRKPLMCRLPIRDIF